MVRNNELKPVGAISKQIARKIREISEAKGLSQEDLRRIIGRSQSYTSLRVKGMKSWTIEELDKLAPKLGYSDAIELMNVARSVSSAGSAYSSALDQLQRVTHRDPLDWQTAAYHDQNKREERESGE